MICFVSWVLRWGLVRGISWKGGTCLAVAEGGYSGGMRMWESGGVWGIWV